uniref:Expansin-like EG45 domain-containing protein n=1 Tax=Bursaphelenchus xylophilus TaxID=6326 RepID=A0A1I7SIN7_BURXY
MRPRRQPTAAAGQDATALRIEASTLPNPQPVDCDRGKYAVGNKCHLCYSACISVTTQNDLRCTGGGKTYDLGNDCNRCHLLYSDVKVAISDGYNTQNGDVAEQAAKVSCFKLTELKEETKRIDLYSRVYGRLVPSKDNENDQYGAYERRVQDTAGLEDI